MKEANFSKKKLPIILPFEVLLVTGLGLMAGVPMRERNVGVAGSDRIISFGRFNFSSLRSLRSLRSFFNLCFVGL